MSSNCGKCGVKLGIYEYNHLDNEVVCDYCAEGRIRAENPLPEDSCWKVVEGFDQLKSEKGISLNLLILFVFLFYLILTVLITIHLLRAGRLTFDLIYLPMLPFMTFIFFSKYRGRQKYRVSGHNVIIRSASDQSERVIDLREIKQYTTYRNRHEYRLTLFTDCGETAYIDASYILNFSKIFACVKENLDTINSGKYYTEESEPCGMRVTFVDPEKAALEK